MPRIGLLSAMKAELPGVIPYGKSPRIQTHTIGHCDVGVLVSGVGQKRAARATERLCSEFQPDHLLVLGVCGGVHPEVRVGTLLVADSVHHKGERASLSGPEFEAITQCLTQSGIEHRVGGMQTFNRTVLSKENVLHDVLGVDMEAYAIAKTAEVHAVPVVIIKSVSDMVPEEKPALIPGVRLLWRVMRNFRRAKKGVNAFAHNYFHSRIP